MDFPHLLRLLHLLVSWLASEKEMGSYDDPEANELFFRAAQQVAEDEGMYRTLTAEQGHSLALVALALFDIPAEKQRQPYQKYLPHLILMHVANGVPDSLTGLYPALLTRHLSWGTNS